MRAAIVLVCFLAALVVVEAAQECQNNCNKQESCEKADESHSTWWCNCNQGWNGADCGPQPSLIDIIVEFLISPLPFLLC